MHSVTLIEKLTRQVAGRPGVRLNLDCSELPTVTLVGQQSYGIGQGLVGELELGRNPQ